MEMTAAMNSEPRLCWDIPLFTQNIIHNSIHNHNYLITIFNTIYNVYAFQMHLQVETLFMKGILSQRCPTPYCKSVEEEQYVRGRHDQNNLSGVGCGGISLSRDA